MPVIGFIYQLGGMHTVALKSAPQSSSFQSAGATLVIRILTTALWAPEDVWEGLKKGKHHMMRAELIRLLQNSAPAHATAVYDSFRLEQQNRIMCCCLRIASESLPQILAVSGKSWLFCHPLAQQCQQYPSIWASDVWPPKLDALYARAQDAGAISLVLGDRHIGFRTTRDQENSVSGALGATPREAWVINGIPISYSASEANSVLKDLGLGPEAKVLEHTRRVLRTTQSWIVHLPPGSHPPEDTLHISKGGRDYFVTLVPASLRQPRGPVVKQFTRGPRRRQTDPETSYAGAVKGDFPPLPTQKAAPGTGDRMQNLERLVSALVGLLVEGGIQLPPPVQALLHEHAPPLQKRAQQAASHAHDNDDDDDDDDDDEDMESDDIDHYEGDVHENMQVIANPVKTAAASGNEPSKRARTAQTPASKDTLIWAHASSLPFKCVTWGRVKGDGNCLWRSVAQLTNADWAATKKAALALAPTLSATWCQYFHVSAAEYEGLVAAMQPEFAWGNELALALLSAYFHRAVIVVTPGVVWKVVVGVAEQPPLIIRLQNRHYDPIQQKITMAMHDAIRDAQAAATEHLK